MQARMANRLLFDVAMLTGAAVVGAWLFVRLAAFRPRTLSRACAHFALSWGAFQLVPPTTRFLARTLPHEPATLLSIAVVTLPALVYVCLSWLWTLAYIRDALPGRPGGGHPVTARH